MLFSLVIPIYNVEKYLERCVNSVLNQDFPTSDYEIILVNDGTKDNSLAIAKKFESENGHIKVISQDNKGLSGARNTGLKQATGKYVWFIDSDDSIVNNCLKGLYEFMETGNLDIAHIGFTHYFNNGAETVYLPKSHPDGVVTGEKFFSEIQTAPTAWSFVHKRQYLTDNQLEFFEGIIHEDEEFLPRALFFAKRVQTYEKQLYAYFENSSSIMGTKSLKSDLNKYIVLQNFKTFIENHSCSESFINGLNFRAFIIFQTMLMPSNFLKHKPQDQALILEKLQHSYFYPIKWKGGFNPKFFLYKTLMNIDLKFYTSLRKFIK
jgi:glycosyltransferase involved in cell wall biosynthesis